MLPLPSSDQCHFTVAFSPCGRWLAAGGSAHAVDVWDLHQPQEPARRLSQMVEPVVRVRYATDGRLIAVSTVWVRTYLPETHELRSSRHVFNVRRAAVAFDGRTIAICGSTLRQQPTDYAEHQAEWSRADLAAEVADVAMTADGRVLAGRAWPTGGGWLDVYDRARGDTLDAMPVAGRPHRIACSADGSLVAVLANGNLSVWNLSTRTAIADRTRPWHGGWLSVAFDPHGRRVVTGGIDSTVAVWDAVSGGPPLTTFQWGVGPVYAVAFDHDGLRAAAAGHSGAVVWDVDE